MGLGLIRRHTSRDLPIEKSVADDLMAKLYQFSSENHYVEILAADESFITSNQPVLIRIMQNDGYNPLNCLALCQRITFPLTPTILIDILIQRKVSQELYQIEPKDFDDGFLATLRVVLPQVIINDDAKIHFRRFLEGLNRNIQDEAEVKFVDELLLPKSVVTAPL